MRRGVLGAIVVSGVSAMLVPSILALRTAPGAAPARPMSAEERVKAVTYADVTPYLEALITKGRDRTDPRKYAAYICQGKDTLNLIPNRDPLLESIARMIMNEDFVGIARHLDEAEFPRGIFERDAELRAVVLPILERKKEEVLRVLREKTPEREP